MNGIDNNFGGITKAGNITGIGKLETTTLSVSAGATMNGIDNNSAASPRPATSPASAS